MSSKKNNIKKIKSKMEKNFTFSWVRLIIFVILAIAIGCTYLVKEPIENFVADIFDINIETTEHGSVITTGDLEVHFIDVGQGDSIAIRFPDDKTMIIDAGDWSAYNTLIPYLNEIFFENDEEKEFDYALVTHSDKDHCGSMDEVYEEFQINCSIRPYEYALNCDYEEPENTYNATEKNTATYRAYIEAVDLENDYSDNRDIMYAHAGIKIESDDASTQYLMEFLTPNSTQYADSNDYSPIILLEYQGKSILFTGDASEAQFEELQNLIETNSSLANRLSRITVYKAAHHGSALEGCNNITVLRELNPEYVVISCGLDNSYGHPHQEFLDNLASVNVNPENIYRTDLNENIIFGISTDDGSLNILSDIAVDPNASTGSGNTVDPAVILYYSWWILAGILLVICFILCFYNYGYKKRNKAKDN